MTDQRNQHSILLELTTEQFLRLKQIRADVSATLGRDLTWVEFVITVSNRRFGP